MVQRKVHRSDLARFGLPLCPLCSAAFGLSVGSISLCGELGEEEQLATITAAHASTNAILFLINFLSRSHLRLRRQAVLQTPEQGCRVGHHMSLDCADCAPIRWYFLF